MRSAPYPPLLFVFVLPAVPLVLAESGGLLGDWTGAEDEDEDELDGVLVVVELSAGGVADELLLIELLSEGVVLLVELGVEEVLDVELGVLMSVVDEVVDEEEGVVVVALLLRSQPAMAAEARARAATRGMSLFMTSPFRNGVVVSDDPSRGRWALRAASVSPAQAVPAPLPRKRHAEPGISPRNFPPRVKSFLACACLRVIEFLPSR